MPAAIDGGLLSSDFLAFGLVAAYGRDRGADSRDETLR